MDEIEFRDEEIRSQLGKILASRTFRSAEGQKGFLRYVVEETIAGHGELIKEYTIGVEAFHRGETFDPRLDPIVRTQARKLRANLAKYYESEGVNDPVRLEFRKGSYVPVFRKIDAAGPEPAGITPVETPFSEEVAEPAPASYDRRWRVIALSVAVAGLAGSAVFYARHSAGFASRAPAGLAAISDRASADPGAYRNYLRGRYFWNKLTLDGLQTAIGYFQQAIRQDPSFARAYVSLADSYVMAPQVVTALPPEFVSKIKAAANRALELDRTLGEAHIDLAICAEYEFDWGAAEREFQKGLALNPLNVVGHLWYAKFLALTGRKDEVLVHRKIAADLDPVSPYAVQAIGGYLSVMGHYDEAIEQFRSALALEPNFGLAHQGLGVAYLLKGRHADAIEELQMASRLMKGPRRTALLGYAYALSGKTAEAHGILNDFLEQYRNGPFPALAIAEIYIGLGDKDQAFQWLERAVDQKDLDVTLQWDSPFEPLRSDPRFARLLRRMKLA